MRTAAWKRIRHYRLGETPVGLSGGIGFKALCRQAELDGKAVRFAKAD
jgi:hypothetical protein